jgi:hypothetical protein
MTRFQGQIVEGRSAGNTATCGSSFTSSLCFVIIAIHGLVGACLAGVDWHRIITGYTA